MDCVKRPVRLNELEHLSRLAQETYRDTFGNSMTKEELESELVGRSTEYFQSAIAKGDTIVVVEDPHDKSLCAFVQFGPETDKSSWKVREPGDGRSDDVHKDAWEIRKLYVRRDWQKKRLGSSLLQLALDACPSEVCICVWEENSNAIELYKRFGFCNSRFVRLLFHNGKIMGEDLVLIRPARQKIQFKRQSTVWDCGLTCVQMILGGDPEGMEQIFVVVVNWIRGRSPILFEKFWLQVCLDN